MSIGNPRVLIVGAGPAGLAAAAELSRCGVSNVLVIDRDDAPGGLPRFCDHPGFGFEYARLPYNGPRFAARMVRDLRGAPVRILAATTLISLREGPTCTVTGPELGYRELRPEVVIIATGIREANRGNRTIPGVRPSNGILTTGLLQQLVARKVLMPPVPRRIVIVGTEHVSFSAILTARKVGISTVAMVGAEDHVRSYPAAAWVARMMGTRLHLCSEIVEICGSSDKVTFVRIRGRQRTHEIACDGVLFSAGWIPETAVLRNGPVMLDAGTGGPIIDQAMRTSLPGVIAVGNVLRGVETSGWAAIEGQRGGRAAALMLAGRIAREQGRDDRHSNVAHSAVPQKWDAAMDSSLLATGRAPSRFVRAYAPRSRSSR